jgi:hypothetical protein
MAIFKATYTKSGAGAKANIRYIQNRTGKDNAKITRTLWGIDGKMERREAYRMLDEAEPGSVFYRLVINFDPATEDTDKDIALREITEQTMFTLEDRFRRHIQWVASTHDDHTPLRHVHILAILPKRLQVYDLQALRRVATEAALAQRREKDRALEQRQQAQEGAQWGQAW